MPRANEIKKGMVLNYNGKLLIVKNIDIQSPSARGAATLYKMRFSDVRTGLKVEERFKGDDIVDTVTLTRRFVDFSYVDGNEYVFMDKEDYTPYTFTKEQIEEMDAWEGSKLNEAKEILAFELTKLVHGEEEAVKAQEGARALFSSGNAAQMPETKLVDEDFEDGKIGILKLMVKAGLATSNGEARRNVEQGGVSVDGNQVKDVKAVFTKDQLSGEGMVVKRGKKNFKKVVLK